MEPEMDIYKGLLSSYWPLKVLLDCKSHLTMQCFILYTLSTLSSFTQW